MPDEIKKEKNVDGLKADNGTIANSRKIVLESIGENENISRQEADKNFSLDSIARKSALKTEESNRRELENEKQKKELNKNIAKDSGLKFIDSINFLRPADIKSEIKNVSNDYQANLNKKLEKNEISPAMIEDINKSGISFDSLSALAKTNAIKPPTNHKQEKTKIKKENKNTVETKKINYKKVKEKKAPPKLAVKKRQKEISDYFKKIYYIFLQGLGNSRNNFSKLYKKSLLLILFFFISLIFIYFVFIFLIIKIKLDKPFLRTLSHTLPIPAFVVKNKVIDFYFWQDIKNQTKPQGNASLDSAARENLARFLAMNELAARYGIKEIDYSDIKNDELKKELAEKAVYDELANQVAIKRIRSIKKMIDEKDDFISVSEKYGDELGKATITPDNKEDFLFYKDVEKLNVNEVSSIVTTIKGYYVFRCFEKTDSEQVLSYVLVNNKNFDQLLSEMILSYEFISFVN